MSLNFLQLNQDKTEILVVGSKAQRKKLNARLNTFGHTPCQQVHNLGVFNSDLNFKDYVWYVTKTAFHHLKYIAKAWLFLSLSDTGKLIQAFISSRLNYCNALLSGLP